MGVPLAPGEGGDAVVVEGVGDGWGDGAVGVVEEGVGGGVGRSDLSDIEPGEGEGLGRVAVGIADGADDALGAGGRLRDEEVKEVVETTPARELDFGGRLEPALRGVGPGQAKACPTRPLSWAG